MLYVFSKSSIGYSHIKEKKICQDFSATYKDTERTIVTCCDGHGGKKYIRSHIGSHMASNAIINVFNSIHPSFFRLKDNEIENKIKLSILCEWNKLIEGQMSYKSIKKHELVNLDEDEILALKSNPATAYGTTLTGALLLGNKLLVVKNEEVYSVDLQTKVEQYICNLSKYKNYGNGMYSINSSDIFEIISSSKVIYTSDYPLEYVTTITTIFSKYIIFNYIEYSNIEYYVTSLK